ncbi:SDR family NAD(P)-dependent oxidoreductase [Neisseria sp. Ec49-e6-T10]|uniref:SDR family NAD(P)-dependent oxidoreductase n=1 Tax=Neisseria sp. Ec49-e6-T10 TaxID=3140744 RepID=UPI003EBFBDB5
MKFQDKVVIVTGGSSGIGEATVKAFASEGAKTVIADFSEKGQLLADQLNNNGHESLFVKVDVTNEVDTQNMVEKVVQKFGRIDVLFANAGIGQAKKISEMTLQDWQKVIDVNLNGVFLSDKYVIEQMLKQEFGGSIVNCGSIHSFVGKSSVTAYAAAKGAVKLLTQTLAIDYAKNNIRVNAVCPGYIDTPLLKDIPIQAKEELIRLHPQGRLGKAEEVANVVLFLASDQASFVNGTTLLVDGGYTAQ